MSGATHEPLRVLLACDRLGYEHAGLHGAGRCMIDWSRGLLARGVEVTPVILRAGPALRAVTEREGLPFVFLQRSTLDPRTLSDFVSLVRRRRIQVLHLQAHGCSTFGRLAARLTHRASIVHVHADYRSSPKGYPWYVRAADRALARHTTRAISVSEHLVPFLVEDQGFRREQVEVWLNPVDLRRFTPPNASQRADARAALGLDMSARVVVAVGRLDRLKGIDVLLDAWRTVSARDASAVLLLVGDGPERAALERLARSHGLGSVRFLGHRSDVRPTLWASDLAAMPSRLEAMGIAALEALACGLPVVASRVGGIPETVRDGQNGLLVPPEDAAALAAAIGLLLSDDARRRSLVAGAVKLVEPYGLDRFVAKLEAKYRELAAASGRE